MVQSWNLAGIRQALVLAARPQWTVPHILVNDIRGIDFEKLYANGVRAVAFDKDNCLTRPYEDHLAEELQDAWSQCRAVFANHICIVSNSAGTPDDHDYKQAKRAEKHLGVPVLRHIEKKPACVNELCHYFSNYNVKPSEIAMIGDRILTDVVYGHRIGAVTILTRQVLGEHGDNWAAKYLRRLEHLWLDRIWPMQYRESVGIPRHMDVANHRNCYIQPPDHPIATNLLRISEYTNN
ncbi:mitochondrial PGP phosphatase-domain-containing protein [Syncephalis plumigaleata]|nr:mitochondrial PGP phosphatase-domain-containing protein [Syncephalis plumigaleata]